MNFELHKFKKIKDDHKSTTLQHPEGHQIKIAKNVLSPKLKEQISKLPMHLAEGGEVSDEELAKEAALLNDKSNKINLQNEAQRSASDYDINPNQYPQAKPVQVAQAQPQPNIIINNTPPQAAPAQMPPPAQVVEAPKQPEPMPENDPYGSQAYSQTLGQGISDVKEGLQKGAEAEGQLGQEQANILENKIGQQQETLKNFQDHYSELENERAAFQQDIQSQHIDPQHYMREMGVGQKVATAIGLILGGMSSGLTGQENPALKFLQAQIDKDIEAQKANLGKRENLLSANFRQFGNLKDATQMTQVMQGDIVKNQLAEAAAKSQDPIVKARAQQAIGDLDTKNAALLSQIAIRKNLGSGVAQGHQDPSAKLRMLSMSGIIPQGQQEHAYKELADAQDTIKAKNNILGAFNQLEKINTLGNAVTSPFQTPKQVAAIKKPIVAALSKGTAGKFTEADAGYLDSLFPAKGDSSETINIKRNRLDKLVSEKMNFPILQSYGINIGNSFSSERFGEGGQKKIVLGAPVATGQNKSAE